MGSGPDVQLVDHAGPVRLEHGRERERPLVAEIVLTSSHQPWAPLPETVGWDGLGDGRVSGPIREAGEEAGEEAADVVADSARSERAYGRSLPYSVTSLTQWLERYGTDDTVLLFLGDHRPPARVSGDRAGRDVPVWETSAFRDRFLTACGSVPARG